MPKQELQPSSPVSRTEPHPASQALGLALSRAASALTNGELPPDALPSAARHGLQNRLADLRVALAPAKPDAVRAILLTLADMPTKGESDPAKLRYSLELAVSDLEGLPEWALASAARAYRRGEIGDGHWRPTAGELAKLARERLLDWHKEASQIDAVLTARIEPGSKPIDADRRKRLADMLREAAAGLVDRDRG